MKEFENEFCYGKGKEAESAKEIIKLIVDKKMSHNQAIKTLNMAKDMLEDVTVLSLKTCEN